MPCCCLAKTLTSCAMVSLELSEASSDLLALQSGLVSEPVDALADSLGYLSLRWVNRAHNSLTLFKPTGSFNLDNRSLNRLINNSSSLVKGYPLYFNMERFIAIFNNLILKSFCFNLHFSNKVFECKSCFSFKFVNLSLISLSKNLVCLTWLPCNLFLSNKSEKPLHRTGIQLYSLGLFFIANSHSSGVSLAGLVKFVKLESTLLYRCVTIVHCGLVASQEDLILVNLSFMVGV